ncbi:hypothetical protein OPQ81_002638 [Rhizoctonia solani]|nr:hypothetical protein OPQ81_002638 [Rhizoctonia solani]
MAPVPKRRPAIKPPPVPMPTPKLESTPMPAPMGEPISAPTADSGATQPDGAGDPAPLKANSAKQPKHNKKPSPIVQKVEKQVVVEQKAKEKKAEKKATKAAKTVINETPEGTEAYLKEMGLIQDQPMPTTLKPVPPVPAAPPKPITANQCSALDQLIQAHHQPSPPLSTISLILSTSSPVSMSPSDSISQVGLSAQDQPWKALGKP